MFKRKKPEPQPERKQRSPEEWEKESRKILHSYAIEQARIWEKAWRYERMEIMKHAVAAAASQPERPVEEIAYALEKFLTRMPDPEKLPPHLEG